MKKHILYILLSLACFSCEIDISDRFRDLSDRRIVLNGQLMPDSIPRVYLSRTLSMVETDSIIALTDAEVKLSVNGQSYYFTGGDKGVYTCEDYIPVAGDQVRIDCSSEGLQDAYALTSISSLPLDLNLNYSIDEEYSLNIEISFSDPFAVTDYYEVRMLGWKRQVTHFIDFENDTDYLDTIMVYSEYYIINKDSLAEISYNPPTSFSVIDSEWPWGRGMLFSDKAFNGQKVNLHFSTYLRSAYNDSVPEINVLFIKRDEAFYRFGESMTRYNPNPDFPIIQPVHIYSNIEDGMGLLISAGERKWTIDVSEVYNDPGFLEELKGK